MWQFNLFLFLIKTTAERSTYLWSFNMELFKNVAALFQLFNKSFSITSMLTCTKMGSHFCVAAVKLMLDFGSTFEKK